ncbi:hypothetical protein C8J56DRAFT_1053351 [Mycena floridula]|nr:hypothetical protein C8J56DRAFT_1053351 [Mycena floridula]
MSSSPVMTGSELVAVVDGFLADVSCEAKIGREIVDVVNTVTEDCFFQKSISVHQFIQRATASLKYYPNLARKLDSFLHFSGERLELIVNETGMVELVVIHGPQGGQIYSLSDSSEVPAISNTITLRALLEEETVETHLTNATSSSSWARAVAELLQDELESKRSSLDMVHAAKCLRHLRRLAAQRGILPPSFFLHNVIRDGLHPVFGGGFADVYKGKLNGEAVCLKALRFFVERPEMAQTLLSDCCREALVWKQLNHPNVLPFLGVNVDLFAPSFCLVSPWMSNGNLMQFLQRNPDFDRRNAITDIAAAMQYLHDYSPPIVHADIRGANVLVSDDLRCCLADFGLSSISVSFTPTISYSGNGKGSTRWLAPELFLMSEEDKNYMKSTSRDIYAFACTILEVYTGQPPFSHHKFDAPVMHDVLAGRRPPRPSGLSEELWTLTESCWRQDPARRPSAHSVMQFLRKEFEVPSQSVADMENMPVMRNLKSHLNLQKMLPPLPAVDPSPLQLGAPTDDLSSKPHATWSLVSQSIEKGFDHVVLENMGTEPLLAGPNFALTAFGIVGSGTSTDPDNIATLPTVISSIHMSEALEKIEPGINSFKMESVSLLVTALDELAQVHCFIRVASLTFKASDAQVSQNVEDVAPDGSTIKARMQELCQQTADDIKACANLCDCYTKKKLVVKVLQGPVWEGKLLKFIALFTKRRSEFEFSLAIHTVVAMDARMDVMMALFQRMVPQEHLDMARMVAVKGGPKACMDNVSILKELMSQHDANTYMTIAHPGRQARSFALEEVQRDLHMDPEAAIEKNSTVFHTTAWCREELDKMIRREGDRIIKVLEAGPHDRIIDPDIHTIWKDMGWRGLVKVKHFVMAVRDYYEESENQVAKADKWALAYINILRMQPLSEAFDDEMRGFLTIAQANVFTTARPLDWSLPRWIAYWAIGWHQSLFMYRSKINDLMAKMFALLPKVKPLNQQLVNDYLAAVYVGITSLQDGVSDCIINDALQEKFAGHVNGEEARLNDNLEAVHYSIDAADTLLSVTGEGRIEKFVMPLLYLLLKHHLDIFRLAQKRNLHADELWDAADTIQWVFKAVNARVEILRSVFGQQKLDLKQHFKTFAHGLLQHINDPSERWNPKVVQSSEPPEYTYDDTLEAEEDLDPAKILNYPFNEELKDFTPHKYFFSSLARGVWIETKDFAAYHALTDSASTFSSHITLALKKVLGSSGWNGFHYRSSSSLVPVNGMIHINFFPEDGSQDGKFKGTWDTESTVVQNGIFMYKCMLPDNFCHYPSPGALKSNKPRALWKFALDAIQARIRKKNLPWCFFEDRRRQRHSFIALFLRTRFGRPLTDKETEELRRIQHGLTNVDNLFYLSVAKLQVRKSVFHAELCESCGGIICGARLSCLTCQLVDKFDTIDFCEHPGCLSQWIVCPHLAQPHLPSHDLLKIRRVVHIRQFGKTYRDAKDALQQARSLLAFASQTNQQEGDSSDSDEDMNEVTCGACKVLVSQPCWFCVHCEKTTFICLACETNLNKGKIMNSDLKTLPNHDIHTHDLVLVQQLVEDVKVSMDDWLEAMDVRLGKVEQGMGKVQRLLEGSKLSAG